MWPLLPQNSDVPPQFYLDDLEDELTLTALRVLVKDLLILVQACNEGVINVLGSSRIFAFVIPTNKLKRTLL